MDPVVAVLLQPASKKDRTQKHTSFDLHDEKSKHTISITCISPYRKRVDLLSVVFIVKSKPVNLTILIFTASGKSQHTLTLVRTMLDTLYCPLAGNALNRDSKDPALAVAFLPSFNPRRRHSTFLRCNVDGGCFCCNQEFSPPNFLS